MHRKLLAGFALTVVFLLVLASPADALGTPTPRTDRRISVSGGVVVTSAEVINGPVVSIDGPTTINGTVNDDVFVGDGRLVIRGLVTGDVLVVSGDVLITGRVKGGVVSLQGRVTTRDGARVDGDVRSRREPSIAPGTVRGDVKTLNVGNLFAGFVLAFLIYLWIAVTLSLAILGVLFLLLFPRAADATAVVGRRFWPTLGWGALVGILGPIIGALLLVTFVGIPLGLEIISALGVLAPLGYVASSLVLGRLMVKGESTGSRIGAFFAGFGILRVVALIPGLGFIVWWLACIYGLGALVRAAWRAGRRAPETSATEIGAAPHADAQTGEENTGRSVTAGPARLDSATDVGPAPGAPEQQPDQDA